MTYVTRILGTTHEVSLKGGNRRWFGEFVISQRKIFKNKFYFSGIFLEHLLE